MIDKAVGTMKRKIGYDYIRIFACFMVIVNHTISSVIFDLLNGYSNTAFIGDFIFNACRMNVFSFILISGALLLQKQESYIDWFRKRVLRIILVIVVFSAMYYDWSNGNIIDYFRVIFSSNITNAYWYLYLYLGLMLTLPITRKMCHSLEVKDFILLTIIFLMTQSIYPLLSHYFSFPPMQTMFSSIFSYWISWYYVFIAGHFLNRLLDWNTEISQKKRFLPVLFLCWIIGNLIPTFITYREMYCGQDTSLFMDNPFLIWSVLATICLDASLIIISTLLVRHTKVNKVIIGLSSLTFGIYLFGDKLIQVVFPYFNQWGINAVVKILVIDILIFIIGALFTLILKKIPVIRKIL